MPDLAVVNLRQKAVLWERDVTDRHGQYSHLSPIEIKCRWDETLGQIRSDQNTDESQTNQLFVDRILFPGSLMFLGTLRDLPLSDNSRIFEITSTK